jgi:hypothetical protein
MTYFDQNARLGNDAEFLTIKQKDTHLPGNYQLSGYDPTPLTHSQYQCTLSELAHFPTVYAPRSDPAINIESKLIHSEVTNPRVMHQLQTRPYVGAFAGAGSITSGHELKNTESALIQGLSSNVRQRACFSLAPSRYTPLPDYGNPQRVQHIIPPKVNDGGWVRGGLPSRDLVRRVNGNCLH